MAAGWREASACAAAVPAVVPRTFGFCGSPFCGGLGGRGARRLEGINITTGEGTVDFYTREGGIGTVLTNDANTVVELYYPEDDANLAELREALH